MKSTVMIMAFPFLPVFFNRFSGFGIGKPVKQFKLATIPAAVI